MGDALAVDVLFSAAQRLPFTDCEALTRRLVEHLVIARQNHDHDLSPLTPIHQRAIGALRAVAETLGHAPTTTQYNAERDRRRAADGTATLPSAASIVREFDSWSASLAAAGLVPSAPPSAFIRRRDHRGGRIVHRYSHERLAHCLRACARDLGRTPMVRDYVSWREHMLAQPRTTRAGTPDIPHHRTYYERYGGWGQALREAGLPDARHQRTETTDYSDLQTG